MKSGRPLATETILKTRKVVKLLENTNNSERDVAKKWGLTQTCVHNIKIRSGLKTKKCMTVPHHTEHQKRRAKTNMTTIHYSKEVENWLNSMNIRFVSRIGNAPNVPITRPIERFWHLCKKTYSLRSCPPTSYRGLQKVWSNLSKEVAESCGQSLMKSVRQKLRLIGRQG